MGFIVRLLIKALSLVYFSMFIIGMLGYFELEKNSTGIFVFFKGVLGKYSLAVPVLCLIFAFICWFIAKSGKEQRPDLDDLEDLDEIADYGRGDSADYGQVKQRLRSSAGAGRYENGRERAQNDEQRRRQRIGDYQRKQRGNASYDQGNYRSRQKTEQFAGRRNDPAANGFPSYFSDSLPVKDETIPISDLHSLGTNFSTYFGQGKRNIYMPGKQTEVNGFRDYFRQRNGLHTAYDKAVNDTVVHRQASPPEDLHAYKKQTIAAAMAGMAVSSPPLNSPPITSPVVPLAPESGAVSIGAAMGYPLKNIKPAEDEIPNPRPAVPKKRWVLPDVSLLAPEQKAQTANEQLNPKIIEDVLRNFGVNAKVINITVGPVITRYELSPAPGTKISKIVNLSDDIALALASREIRIEAPIPGKAAVGIEIPRRHPRTVYFRELIDSEAYRQNPGKLRVALGKDIADVPTLGLLDKMPHLLVAGATGSGKSIFINCLVNSILFNATPEEVRLLLIDPKMVELNVYNGIPHLLTPVVTDPKKANKYLKYIVREMEIRYELFAANGVRDIEHYNKTTTHTALPYIVVIIDELADLMMVAAHEVEEVICRLAQMARAAGIHLVIATQRPSVNVITGLIKANIPSRISFAVSSQIDSRTILDSGGAEKLLGKGDMLYAPIGLGKPLRLHGCYIDEKEVKNVIDHWKRQGNPVFGIDEEQLTEIGTAEKGGEDFDDRFIEAAELVITTGIASVSFLQRRLRVGYSRAARLMDMLEEAGVVSRSDGNKAREILMSLESFQSQYA